jgi:methionine salvage enolase-phosphatase E1
MSRKSSIEPKERPRRGKGQTSKIETNSPSDSLGGRKAIPSELTSRAPPLDKLAQQQQQPQQQQLLQQPPPQAQKQVVKGSKYNLADTTQFRFFIPKPQAIVIDLLGVLICRSFMSSSKEFRDFFQHNVLEYLNDNWKQKQLKIMINFFRCSQQNVPDEYKLADREESKEEQIKQAKKHVIWKLRNDPTNSALSLFMLGITEWGYKNRTLTTQIYDDVPVVLKYWKEQAKIPVYVGVGSADFLIMVLSNTNYGNLLPYFNGHMNIMDYDGTKANKDFKKLLALLRCAPDRVLYLTRFRQDCKRAMEMGMQSLIILRPDFDNHNLIEQLKIKRGNSTSMDGTKMARGAGLTSETVSPPNKRAQDADATRKDPEIKRQVENNISSLSLIDDHDETDRYNTQSSQIVEQDLTKYSIVLSLAEIAFK